MASPNRSAKIRLRQCRTSQVNRRVTVCGIHQLLGVSPFLIKAALNELVVRYDIHSRSRLLKLREKVSCQRRVKCRVNRYGRSGSAIVPIYP